MPKVAGERPISDIFPLHRSVTFFSMTIYCFSVHFSYTNDRKEIANTENGTKNRVTTSNVTDGITTVDDTP